MPIIVRFALGLCLSIILRSLTPDRYLHMMSIIIACSVVGVIIGVVIYHRFKPLKS
jgi:TRAP-type uncharacterized transport system fused permease subunit